MIHLKSIALRLWESQTNEEYPFNLPVVKSLEELSFTTPVTFLVGENGSGKSTVLEALACAAGSIAVGSESLRSDPSLATVRKLAGQMRLAWSKRTHKGFFLRAEDFFGYAKKMTQTRQELMEDYRAVEEDYKGRSKMAADLARMPYATELNDMKRRYGDGLEAYSHGESFMTLFQSRFVPDGLYLLDEPEAPLSPIRQLAFLAALKRMVDENAQFIIATHSPIIMAFPGATILNFDGARIRPVAYEDLEHVRLTRDFLNNPQAYLGPLFEEN
ncbi:MAG TPA: AAA family ATPase [Anaerolineaceae bacterium]|nr:AAA family ATPase [Anaerolineaceae bacterium]